MQPHDPSRALSAGAMTLAMRAVTSSHATRVLRVGLIQRGQLREERVLRGDVPLRVGTDERNTFIVLGDGVPSNTELFVHTPRGWTLRLHPALRGRIARADGVHRIEDLARSQHVEHGPHGPELEIDESTRGHLEMGNAKLVFQFVVPPPRAVQSQLPAVIRGRLGANADPRYNACLAFFVMLGFGAMAYAEYGYDPVVEDNDDLGRMVRLIPPPPPDEPVVAIAQPKPDTRDNAPASQPRPSPAPAPAKTDTATSVASNTHSSPQHASSSNSAPNANTSRDVNRALQDVTDAIADLDNSPNAAAGIIASINGDNSFHTAAINRGEMDDLRGAMSQVAAVSTAPPPDGVVTRSPATPDPAFMSTPTPGGPSTRNPDTQINTQTGPVVIARRGRIETEPSELLSDNGNLDPASVNRQINNRLTAIRTCYERVLRSSPDAHGSVSVRFNVCSTGGVGRVRRAQVSGLEGASQCIANVIRGITFQDPGDNMCVDFSRNFALDPAN